MLSEKSVFFNKTENQSAIQTSQAQICAWGVWIAGVFFPDLKINFAVIKTNILVLIQMMKWATRLFTLCVQQRNLESGKGVNVKVAHACHFGSYQLSSWNITERIKLFRKPCVILTGNLILIQVTVLLRFSITSKQSTHNFS